MNNIPFTSAAHARPAAVAPHDAFGLPDPDGSLQQVPLLTRYARILARRKWLIIGSVLAALLIGLVATMLMTPLYTSTATVEISREAANIVEVEGVEPESSSADMEFYQTQYGLLKSESLAARVAQDLRLVEDEKFFEIFDAEGSLFEDGAAPRRMSVSQR